MTYKFCALLLAAGLFTGCASNISVEGNSQTQLIDINNIRTNLEFIASDELEGRETATRGEYIASLYITTQLKKNNVKPFFGNSYLQPYNVISTTVNPDSKINVIDSDDTTNLVFIDDFIVDRHNPKSVDVSAGMIFAGYGISATEFGYDDYSGLDVKGKIVVILNGEPGSDNPDFFDGDQVSKYSDTDLKVETAKEHGAAGCLIKASARLQGYWGFLKRFLGSPSISLFEEDSTNEDNFIDCYINQDSFGRLFENQEYSYEKIIEMSENNITLPYFNFSGTVEISIKKESETKVSNNIIGVIEGNDPVLKNEYVAIGAHYDHLGINNDKVYNGADDDGSGTVAVMELAKAFAKSNLNKRSIIVVFHSGEEKGLFGSEYLSDNLPIMDRIVAQINLDMIGRESADTIYSVGSDKLSSELKTIVEEVNRETVNFVFNYQFDDPNDPERIFYRSDHYNYARKGIPIVFFTDNMQEDYHKDSDDVEKINFEKIYKSCSLVYSLAERIANMDHRLIVDKVEKESNE